jgi:hypothetical protein
LSSGKDALQIVPLHLPHPILLRAAEPITKRSKALRATSLNVRNSARASNIEPGIKRPARHKHGTVLEGVKTKPLRGGR